MPRSKIHLKSIAPRSISSILNPIFVDIQIATRAHPLPKKHDIAHWINTALNDYFKHGEVCVRLISPAESRMINKKFRFKDSPTNIISFSYPRDSLYEESNPLLGDLAICASIVNKEAKKYKIPFMARWAHIIIHGCLHLAGLDHKNEKDACVMETKEALLLKQLGFYYPFQEDKA